MRPWRLAPLERDHRRGAGFHRGIACDFELPHHFHRAGGGLGRRRGLTREDRARGRLGVDGVRLARRSTQPPIRSIHFHDSMAGTANGPRQADAVAAGPFDPERFDRTVRLGPGDQRPIPLRIGVERVVTQTHAPTLDRHRDMPVLVGIDPDYHGRRFQLVGQALCHRCLLGLQRTS